MLTTKRSLNRNVCLVLILLMVSMPFFAAAPAMAETGGVLNVLIRPHREVQDIPAPSDVSPMATCTPAASNWVISSGTVTCTGQTITVTDSVTIQNGATLVLEGGTTLNINVGSYYYYAQVTVNGKLRVENSTIKSATGAYWYMLSVQNTGTLHTNGATIRDSYYGIYSYGAVKLEVNSTTVSNSQYYGCYISNVGGYITNSTFTNAMYYGIMAQNLVNFKISNNTIKSSQYGVYFYSFNGEFNDNLIQSNSYYGGYFYMTTSTINRNRFVQNTQGGIAMFYNGLTFQDCSFTNNGKDVILESATAPAKSINSRFATTSIDNMGWGGSGSKLEVYWWANASVKWESDGSPVKDAIVTVEDNTGQAYPTELITDANGKVNMLSLMEYVETKSGKTNKIPYYVNATGVFDSRDIKNFTQLDVTKDGENFATLTLENLPPPLAITAPENNLLTNRTNVTVTGVTERNVDPVNRPLTIQIKVGSSSYSPVVGSNGEWSQVVSLPSDGTHTINVKAYDWVLNKAEAKVTVRRDTVNPPLEITTPVDELLTNQTVIPVEGTTEPGATLKVNNKVITVDAEGKWATTVTLSEGDNLISITSMDPAQNWLLRQRAVKLDTKAPILMVGEPMDGYKTSDKNLRVSGITEPYARVTLNGAPMAVAGANFQASLSLSEGENKLFFDAVDAAGNHNYTWRTVLLDTIPPTLEITEPAVNNLLTNKMEITIKGYVDPGAKIYINKDSKDYSGEWTYVLQLKEGKNKFTVEAIDIVGNKVQLGRTIIRDTTPPMLAVFSPINGATVVEPTAMVEGSVEPGASLTVNGVKTSTLGGVFSTPVTLVEGENTITLIATDEASNTKTEVRTVTLDTVVNLVVNTDLNTKTVKTANMTVTGKTDPGSQVFVNGEPAKVRADGSFSHPVNLLEGNNTIRVQAVDQYTNTETVEMWVVLKSPSTFGNFGGGSASQNLMVWILVITLLVASVGAIVGHNIYSKRKAQDAEIKAQQEAQATELKKDAPDAIYQSLYGGQQAYPSAPTEGAPMATGTATPVDGTATGMVPMETTAKLDDVEAKINAAEASGTSGVAARRNLRLARQFASRGNAAKAEYYAEKALDDLGAH